MPLRLFRYVVFLIVSLTIATSYAQPAKPYVTPNAPLLGSAWYPKQWPEPTWDSDLALMEQAHMNVVRIGEFAWSTEEPSEGHYDLDWLDRAITLAAKHHLAVVMSTPTDAPPAWLTTKYPDTLGMNADGHLREHGNRRQFNYASPHYRQLCALIVAQLARRFGRNPNIIGWQIGNEYSDESFDPATRVRFQQFLRAKYKTLDNLNQRWTTAYWSQTYTDWSQIPLAATHENPALLLEHKHFVTETWRSFQREQIEILRPNILPGAFITTNIGGLAWSDNWDHYRMTEDLDLASWDDYVGQGHLDTAHNAMLNDFVRGWKRENFWVMETQPGSVNWAPTNNALDKGETRALAWQTIGHGADAVLYWQWRSALNGQEQYHGAIVGPDGIPLPLYEEIKRLGHDLELTRADLAGSIPHAEIALLNSYDSRWTIDFQPHTKDYDQQQILQDFYKPLMRIGELSAGSVDIVEATAFLNSYKLIVAPSLNVIPQSLADHLLDYVRQGGHLILGPRSGMKDEFDGLDLHRQPGPLVPVLGGRVEQFYALDTPVALGDGIATIWAEQLSTALPDTAVDLRYGSGDGWLAGQPAMIARAIGKGSIAYLGTVPDAKLLQSILEKAASNAGIAPRFASIPADIELCVRVGATHTVYLAINHGASPQVLTLPYAMLDVLANKSRTAIALEPQGVAILIDKGQP